MQQQKCWSQNGIFLLDIYSVTSFTELRREALDNERWNMLNPDKKQKISIIQEIISDQESPIVASTDYMKSYAEQMQTSYPISLSL